MHNSQTRLPALLALEAEGSFPAQQPILDFMKRASQGEDGRFRTPITRAGNLGKGDGERLGPKDCCKEFCCQTQSGG